MPIYDQTYKAYSGLRKRGMLWFVISKQVASRATKGCLPWVTLAGQGIFVLVMSAFMFFTYKASEVVGESAQELGRAANQGGILWLNGDQSLATVLYMILQFSTIPAFLLTMVTGGGSFSSDLRYNALPLYFSRPLSQKEYIWGKIAGVALVPFLALAATVLIISLQFTAYFMDLKGLVREIPTILLGLGYAVGYSLFLAILIGGFSSMCKSARNANGLFIGFFILGSAIGSALENNPATRAYAALSPIQALNSFAVKLFEPDFSALVMGGRRGRGAIQMNEFQDDSMLVAATVLVVTTLLFLILISRNARSVEVVK